VNGRFRVLTLLPEHTSQTLFSANLSSTNMTALVSGHVDLEKPGKYPIVLSDALMGKGTKEVFTNIRCKSWTPSKKAKLKINFFSR
jgi:hypothetical protein